MFEQSTNHTVHGKSQAPWHHVFLGEAGASFARKLFEHKVDFCTNCSLIASWTDRSKAFQRLILGLFG
jgi:hypothetical protein